MTTRAVRAGSGLASLALTGLLLTVAGCGEAGPPGAPPEPSTPPPPTATTDPPGPVYRLSGSLCDKADLGPLEELWPRARTPLADTERLCTTARVSSSMTVSVTVDANLLPDAASVALYLETGRRLSPWPAKDIAGAGGDAFWAAKGSQAKLTAGHGNLILEVDVLGITDGEDLPDDIAERLARVAAGTFARLAP
jgi:hypothetical protein